MIKDGKQKLCRQEGGGTSLEGWVPTTCNTKELLILGDNYCPTEESE